MVSTETKTTTDVGARQRSTPAEGVDALNLAFGKQANVRGSVRDGILSGRFTANHTDLVTLAG